MAVALRGNLQDFGIAEVFQLIGQQRKTGMLKFRTMAQKCAWPLITVQSSGRRPRRRVKMKPLANG